jgi:hypothetical protein
VGNGKNTAAAWRAAEEKTKITIPLHTDPAPANVGVQTWVTATGQATATTTTFTNPEPAKLGVTNWQADTNITRAMTTTETNSQPATAGVTGWKNVTDNTGAMTTTDSNTKPAQDKVDNFVRLNDGRVINVGVRVGITVTGSATGTVGAGGGITVPWSIGLLGLAEGGTIEAFANGGLKTFGRGLRPMPGGKAVKVPPNSWRIIGDNMKVPESYIPWERTQRNLSLLNDTANALGEPLARSFANGGTYPGFTGTVSVSPVITQTGGVGELQKQMQKMVDTIERYGTGPVINVNDRSGDPVQTGREVQQALRLGT